MSGIIGKKLGMTQFFTDDGQLHGVTAIEAGPCTITQVKTSDKDGYTAVQLGFGTAKRLNAPEKGHLGHGGLNRSRKRENHKAASKPASPLGMFRYLREFSPSEDTQPAPGDVVTVDIFAEGQYVDISGVSKGKGFAGGVKRYHFAGGPKTHGQSDRHRAPGSIGSGTTPGRVLKGLHMAGHLGHKQITQKSLQVLKVDPERNILLVKGAVPGPTNGLVLIRQAKKKTKSSESRQ